MKLYKLIFLILICDIITLKAQELIVLKVINKQDKSPVTYANIQVKNKSLGAYSNEQGKFDLNLNIEDTLLISSIGYEKLEIPFSSIKNTTIYFQEKSTLLKEIKVFPKKESPLIEVGYFNKRGKNILKMGIASKFDNAVYIENTYKSTNFLIQKVNLSIKKENEDVTILKIHLYNAHIQVLTATYKK